MKALLITTLVMGFISVNAASAAQEINHADGKEKIGVVLYKFVITKLLLDKIIERIGLIFLSALCVVKNFNF